MKCPICDRPDAQAILLALQKGKNEAVRVSGTPRGTFFGHIKKHLSLPPHGPVVPPPLQTPISPPSQLDLLSLDLKASDPEDLLWAICKEMVTLGKSAKNGDQNRLLGLRDARDTILAVQKLRASKPEIVDNSKNDAELQRSLLEKLDQYLPPEKMEGGAPVVVQSAPLAQPAPGIVH